MIHRPLSVIGAYIWISYSPDLRHWGSHKLILPARRGAWWDANITGLSPPPIETSEGWLIIYHGVKKTAAGCLYRLGLVWFDLQTPEKCLLRGDSWIFWPEEEYEPYGDVDNVVFPCGYTIAPDGDTINLYYGGADTCIALATGSIRALLDWLRRNGRPEPIHKWAAYKLEFAPPASPHSWSRAEREPGQRVWAHLFAVSVLSTQTAKQHLDVGRQVDTIVTSL